MDVSLLICAVPGVFPCGDDLEYDADFLQLTRDAAGKPERTMGDAVQPAQPPQWPLIQQASAALLQRSKDLRIANYWLQSDIALNGIGGLANGLYLIHELLRQYWPHLHPQLDPDDDNDSTVRINALSTIACDTNLRLLSESMLVRSPHFGSVSLRAALSASGVQPSSNETLTAEQLTATLRSSEPEQLRSVYGALSQAHTRAEAIEDWVSEQVGSAQGVDLSPVKTVLKHALHILSEFGPGDAIPSIAQPSAAPSSADMPTTAPSSTSEPISSRDDVLRCLERVLTYYAHHEPSSPLPLLLTRAKLLVHADFAAIVRNLIPDGVPQLEKLCGPQDG